MRKHNACATAMMFYRVVLYVILFCPVVQSSLLAVLAHVYHHAGTASCCELNPVHAVV